MGGVDNYSDTQVELGNVPGNLGWMVTLPMSLPEKMGMMTRNLLEFLLTIFKLYFFLTRQWESFDFPNLSFLIHCLSTQEGHLYFLEPK